MKLCFNCGKRLKRTAGISHKYYRLCGRCQRIHRGFNNRRKW